MSQPDIISKLKQLLTKGITNEPEAVYLMVELRKLLEGQGAKKSYEYLTFHCDWAVHVKLQGPTAQNILRWFDNANPHLKGGVELHELPISVRAEIERISTMRYFEKQFDRFLKENGLPSLESTRPDGWTHFLHLYVKVVEDCPLIMRATNPSASIASVTLRTEVARKRIHGEIFYKVSWIIQDKNGKHGRIDIFNSFSAT